MLPFVSFGVVDREVIFPSACLASYRQTPSNYLEQVAYDVQSICESFDLPCIGISVALTLRSRV